MLSHTFRSQLLMDGSYGRLGFVATQSDVLQPTEIMTALQLPRTASVQDCANARNAFTAQRIQKDFLQGLAEMARDAGEEVSDAPP